MAETHSRRKPVVLACAGCSHAGRLAYDVALELDRLEVAEMSCLAGVAAEKAVFLAKLRNRAVWIVDGCPVECCQGVLDRLRQRADLHIRLHELGIHKKYPAMRSVDLDELVTSVLALAASSDAPPPASPPDESTP